MAPKLEAIAVAKQFRPRGAEPLTALDDISLSLERGAMKTVVARHGGGKTTLLRVLAGSLHPTHGQVFVDGVDLYSCPRRCFSRPLLLQRWGPPPRVKLQDWLSGGARPGTPRGAETILRAVGLWDVRCAPVAMLASIEQRMAAVAAALLRRPTLLLDDPFLGFAPAEAEQAMALVAAAARAVGATLLVASVTPLLKGVAWDEVFQLERGRIGQRLARDQTPGEPERPLYRILVRGHLSPRWAEQLDEMQIIHTAEGNSLLVGPLADHSALYGLLIRLHNLHVALLEVSRQEPGSL